jgi:hypothetical protein
MKRRVHANSRAAYASGRLDHFPRRAREILAIFERATKPLTDREVMIELGRSDPNAVRPRITELVEAGVLVELDPVVDLATGKRVRACKIAIAAAQRALDFT